MKLYFNSILGFLVALPLATIIIIGYQRKWYRSIRKCNYRKFQNTTSTMELHSDISIQSGLGDI